VRALIGGLRAEQPPVQSRDGAGFAFLADTAVLEPKEPAGGARYHRVPLWRALEPGGRRAAEALAPRSLQRQICRAIWRHRDRSLGE
jgi:hypothetical protein